MPAVHRLLKIRDKQPCAFFPPQPLFFSPKVVQLSGLTGACVSLFFFFFLFLNEEQFRRIHESRQCTGVLRNFAETFPPCGAASEPQKLTASFLEDEQRGRQLLQGRRPVTIWVRGTCVPVRKVALGRSEGSGGGGQGKACVAEVL